MFLSISLLHSTTAGSIQFFDTMWDERLTCNTDCMCVLCVYICVVSIVCCAFASEKPVLYACTSVFGCVLCLHSGNGPGSRVCVWSEGNYGHAPREEAETLSSSSPAAPAFLVSLPSISIYQTTLGSPSLRKSQKAMDIFPSPLTFLVFLVL